MQIIKKIHIYAGLLCFTQLLVYGVAGLVASSAASRERSPHTQSIRYVPFETGPSLTDRQVAAIVYRKLALPMTTPIRPEAVRRTPENQLQLDFYHVNGIYRVVVLENEKKLRIEEMRRGLPVFLEQIHTVNLGEPHLSTVLRLWAIWNEVAMVGLLLFSLSGLYLWLSSRPQLVWSYATLLGSTLVLAGLWWSFR